MSAKKKKNKKGKGARRRTEILKAQAKSGARGVYQNLVPDLEGQDPQQPKKLTHRLHVKEIKTDLIKTAIFAVFVVVLLTMLKKSGLQLDLGIYK
jgi:hypothetical protein